MRIHNRAIGQHAANVTSGFRRSDRGVYVALGGNIKDHNVSDVHLPILVGQKLKYSWRLIAGAL
jgi:hypothetical protein